VVSWSLSSCTISLSPRYLTSDPQDYLQLLPKAETAEKVAMEEIGRSGKNGEDGKDDFLF
jgi:hypothetical protein